MAFYFTALLALIVFLSSRMHGVPQRFNTARPVVITAYALFTFLLILVINQSINYSEHVKVIVFSIVYMITLFFVNLALIIMPVYNAAIDRVASNTDTNSNSNSSEQKIQGSDLSSALNHVIPRYVRDKDILIGNASRLPFGFLQHWENEIMTIDQKTNYVVFESTLTPGLCTTFNIKSAIFDVAPGFGEGGRNNLEFLVKYKGIHSVILSIKPNHEDYQIWVRTIKKFAEKKLSFIGMNKENPIISAT